VTDCYLFVFVIISPCARRYLKLVVLGEVFKISQYNSIIGLLFKKLDKGC
jgi:hypothetical protein